MKRTLVFLLLGADVGLSRSLDCAYMPPGTGSGKFDGAIFGC